MRNDRFNKRGDRPNRNSGNDQPRDYKKNSRFDSSSDRSSKYSDRRESRDNGRSERPQRDSKPYDSRNKDFKRDRNDFGSDRRDSRDDRRSERPQRDSRPYDSRNKDFKRDRNDFGSDRRDSRDDRRSERPQRDSRPYDSRNKDFKRDRNDFGSDRRDSRDDRRSERPQRDSRPYDSRNKDFKRDRNEFGSDRRDSRDNRRFDRSGDDSRPFNPKSRELRKGRDFNSDRRGPRDNKRFDRSDRDSRDRNFDRSDRDSHERVYDKRNKRLNADRPTRMARTPDYNFDKIKEIAKKRGKTTNSRETRLNKYIANAGVCSRRDADALIAAGDVSVNGKIVTEMGYKVIPKDEIRYKGKLLKRERMIYVLLNKPKDFITTTNDPENRKTVMNLVSQACEERIYPVGRLDRQTTGLLLFTNDGELAGKLAHPSNNVKKLYHVELDKPITEEHFAQISEGVKLEDGVAKVDNIALIDPTAQSIGLEIHIGKNRIVRRIFEHLGYEVVKLDRTIYAGLTKKDLPRGNWRFLTEKELIRLKYFK